MRRYRLLWILLTLSVLLAACGRPTPPPATPTPLPTSTPRPPTPSPTASAPSQHLVLCATEPQYASPFAPSQAGDDLLALFFEPPVERVNYRWQPRLVTHLPSFATGDAITRTAQVPMGGRYADIAGAVKTHEGSVFLRLPQLVVTFTLQADLRWSNGEPLTAEDAVLGYHLAQAPEAQGRWPELVERTARFVALDEHTLRWEGIPGYLSADYAGFLFPPQPAHRWQGKTLPGVLEDRTPPATGPFKITAWEAGREVRLQRNPHYAGAEPRLASITYRFPQTAPSGWTDLLLAGTCDVLLPDPVMATDLRLWDALKQQGAATLWADAAPVVLRLDFNLDPRTQEPGPLADPKVRRALAQCVDRTRLTQALPGEALIPASGFIPPGHPAYAEPGTAPAFDPEAGQARLAAAGWRDEDADGLREAYDVAGIADGTPLSLTLHLAPQYFAIAAYISADLETCGAGVRPEPTETQLLYANDAVSPLFGRTFEMAVFGWWAELPEMCGVWRSGRIPNEDNDWVGENFGSYTSEAYDAACRRALTALTYETQAAALQEAQALLLEDVPTLFLAWRPYWFVTRPPVQGLRPDVSAPGALWNSETVHLAP